MTTTLALTLVLLGVLAAQHDKTPQEKAGHAVLAELQTVEQPIEGGASPDIAGEQIALGLATGCIVLIACCTLGLAILAARTWRASPFRLLSANARAHRDVIHSIMRTAPIARPSLVALSISRT